MTNASFGDCLEALENDIKDKEGDTYFNGDMDMGILCIDEVAPRIALLEAEEVYRKLRQYITTSGTPSDNIDHILPIERNL